VILPSEVLFGTVDDPIAPTPLSKMPATAVMAWVNAAAASSRSLR
jgi:hypothetical protein